MATQAAALGPARDDAAIQKIAAPLRLRRAAGPRPRSDAVLIRARDRPSVSAGVHLLQVVVRLVQWVEQGLDRIGHGEFSQGVAVPNRDEPGELAERVNRMGGELERLYANSAASNENLQ